MAENRGYRGERDDFETDDLRYRRGDYGRGRSQQQGESTSRDWQGSEYGRYGEGRRGQQGSYGGRGYGGNFPTYEELMLQTDWDGENHGYLASEENFRFIKGLQEKNLIVPVVGNFAGPKALRSIGRYIRARGSVVNAFYVSNVEQYLFQDMLFEDFARNVATCLVGA